jgi:hypothetical protein
MRAIKFVLAALGLLCCPSAPVAAADFVLGDSLGVGVAMAARVKGLAKISVHIRGPKAPAQIAQVPEGSTAFVVLGTNDAEGSIARLDKSIDDIVETAESRRITLIWLGPPCVRKAWDARARELDAMLREKLAGTSVRYVSMRDEEICSGVMHEPDGVHLKMKGYVYMWQKARIAAGYPVDELEAPPATTATVPPRAALASEASGQRGNSIVRAHSASEDIRAETPVFAGLCCERAGATRPELGSSARAPAIRKAERIPLPVPRPLPRMAKN